MCYVNSFAHKATFVFTEANLNKRQFGEIPNYIIFIQFKTLMMQTVIKVKDIKPGLPHAY